MVTFWALLKNGIFQFKISLDSLWETIGKIGFLLISTSCHTGLAAFWANFVKSGLLFITIFGHTAPDAAGGSHIVGGKVLLFLHDH